jgi:hypothetical protein
VERNATWGTGYWCPMSTLAMPRAAVRALSTRVLVLWALVHGLYGVVTLLGASPTAASPDPLAPNALWLVVVCTALLFVDVRRRGERALWGNLGISATQLAVLCAAVCLIAEMLLTLARR